KHSELEAQLAENKQAQARLRHELAESQKQLREQQQKYLAESSKLDGATEAKQPTATQAEQTKRQEGAERKGGEAAEESNRAGRKGALDAIRGLLGGKLRLVAKRREEQQEAQNQTQAPQESFRIEPAELEPRTQQLQATQVDIMQLAKRLTVTLGAQTK